MPSGPDPSHDLWTIDLERALLRELRGLCSRVNEERFGKQLRPAVLVLSNAASRLGRWLPETRTIELSRIMVITRPWAEVASVLEHELAHQFVSEVCGIRDEAAHGPTFQRVCAERGIDARAAGAPTGAAAIGVVEVNKTLERIRRLLALADSPNQHEAELAMRKAHELMLRHNIETIAGAREYEVRHLGNPAKRTNRVESDVVSLLAEFFFVKVIRVPVYLPLAARTGFVYEIAGTAANVEMATHVYEFLLATAERLWRGNRGDARVRSGRDRMPYQSGVIGGFREKLRAERTVLRGTGLIWVGDSRLEKFYRTRHPHITRRRRAVRINGAHAAGQEAGRTIVLHKPVANGPSGGPTRLLRG